jgi:hypothetical protein
MLTQVLKAHEHSWLSWRYWFTYVVSLPVFSLFANFDPIAAQLYYIRDVDTDRDRMMQEIAKHFGFSKRA